MSIKKVGMSGGIHCIHFLILVVLKDKIIYSVTQSVEVRKILYYNANLSKQINE